MGLKVQTCQSSFCGTDMEIYSKSWAPPPKVYAKPPIMKFSLSERNPVGRTGMIGRGLLGRWGPNHAADPVVTRYKMVLSNCNLWLFVLQLISLHQYYELSAMHNCLKLQNHEFKLQNDPVHTPDKQLEWMYVWIKHGRTVTIASGFLPWIIQRAASITAIDWGKYKIWKT